MKESTLEALAQDPNGVPRMYTIGTQTLAILFGAEAPTEEADQIFYATLLKTQEAYRAAGDPDDIERFLVERFSPIEVSTPMTAAMAFKATLAEGANDIIESVIMA